MLVIRPRALPRQHHLLLRDRPRERQPPA